MRHTFLSLLLAVTLVFTVNAASAELFQIPLDWETLLPVDPQFYLSDTLYEDPSLRVEITPGRAYDTDYLVVRIKMANATQLRTYVDHSSNGNYADTMAKHIGAVLAITGDSFRTHQSGQRRIIYRQGQPVMVQKWPGACFFDMLLIDDAGDFHILKTPTTEEAQAFIDSHDIVNSFCFGPALVIDGEVQPIPKGSQASAIGWVKRAQRLCICQTGELEYMVVVTGGPDNPHCKGMTGEEFVYVICEQGIPRSAYNLDAGNSAWVVFNNEKINLFGRGRSQGKRRIEDIIYFASAWHAEPPEPTATPEALPQFLFPLPEDEAQPAPTVYDPSRVVVQMTTPSPEEPNG